jgi:hypothetical protein
MHYREIYEMLQKLEWEYKKLKEELDKANLLKSEKYCYLTEDKEAFKRLWKKYILFFEKLKRLLKESSYRKYFFITNYNNLILRKYLVHFYFKALLDLLETFWEHEDFIRGFLNENFQKDYWVYAKHIYLPRHINMFNTPRIFIDPFKNFIDKDIFLLLDTLKETEGKNRILTDYSNVFFYIRNRVYRFIFFISKNIGYVIAHTKFSPRKYWLVKKENIDTYLEFAKPWDIFLSRWNWNASNLSIPWFWKHMSMYLWTGKYLKENFDGFFLLELKDENHYIIEATWEWIKIVDLYDFILHIDYLGVSRTNFEKEKIERVLKNSLVHIWKWYDYIFNYYSDKRFVCSSLVLKAYAKEKKEDKWIDIALENIWIGLIFSPNKFIDILLREKEKLAPSVFPLFFIDSIEKTWENFISNTDEFLKTGNRPKLSIFLN